MEKLFVDCEKNPLSGIGLLGQLFEEYQKEGNLIPFPIGPRISYGYEWKCFQNGEVDLKN